MSARRDVETLLVEDHSRAIGSLVLSLPVGSLHDPPGKSGLSYLTGQMLLRGAGGMDHGALLDELELLGSALSVGVGRSRTSVSGDALSRNVDAFEGLVSAILAAPALEEAELDRLKRQTLAEIAQVRDSDSALGQRFFVKDLFEGHPYGRPLKGTEATVRSITIDDVRAFYRDKYAAGGVVVAAAADLTRERVAAFIERTVARLPADAPAPLEVPPIATPRGFNLTVVDKPERSQTQCYLGHITLDANHEDFFPLLVAHTAFGGTFTARLSREIRDKRGWSYGAYSYLSTDPNLGTFTMRFYPSTADAVPAMSLADELFRALTRDGVTDAEADFAKRYLANSHAFSVDTAERRVSELLSARLNGRPADFVDTFVARIEAVTTERINAAIRAHLHPEAVTAAIVGTASDLEASLAAWERPTSTRVFDYRTDPFDAP